MTTNSFLALLPVNAEIAQIFGALGPEARRVLLGATREIELPAPTGAGLHVWEGRIQGDDMDGEWRRATVTDLERFGFPLSAPSSEGAELGSNDDKVAASPSTSVDPGFCCNMRKKFLIGIVAVDESMPTPVDLVDHVLTWGKKVVFAISYCPFCGRKLDHTQAVRTLEGMS